MKSAIATLAIAFALCLAGTAVAGPLEGNPSVVTYSDGPRDLRSPDAADFSASTAPASDLAVPSDDGLGALMIVLIAAGGVLAFGGAGFTMRRVMLSRRHAVG